MEIIDVIGKYRKEGREWYTRDIGDITKITVHHTASRTQGTNEAILESLMNTHLAHDWPGLAYHFIILKDGSIYQINKLEEVTWHDTHNWDSIGVCLHGYFHPDYNETPTKEQLLSLDRLLDNLCTEHPEFPADFDDVVGHRERSSTACPGNFLFPKVVEYRTALGDVDWGSEEVSPIDEATLRKIKILWDDMEGHRHEVEWYPREWWNEKTRALNFESKFKESEGLRIIAEKKNLEKDDLYEGLTKQVGIMSSHVEAIQKSFSEFGYNQSLMGEIVKTIQGTVTILSEALETSYGVWENDRAEMNVKVKIADGNVDRLQTEVDSLRDSLKNAEEINARDLETVPNKMIKKEFWKIVFGKR